MGDIRVEARREQTKWKPEPLLHPSGIMIKDERKVMDGRHGMISWGGR